MDPELAQGLRALVQAQPLASLGTLHEGEPFVSMAPFALLPDARGFVVHVSRLAAHTRDMLADPRVSLLVMSGAAGVPPQAVARVTVQGDARPCPEADGEYAAARAAYLGRFPESEMLFGLADFSLFVIRPRSARYVGGFAQARTLTGEGLARILGSTA